MRNLALPHELTDKNRQDRVEACRENLDKITKGKWRLCNIITCDESWFYLRQIGHKSSNASWVKEGEGPRTVIKWDRFEPKNMFSIFFKTTGMIHIDCMENGATITSDYYIENCLKPVIEEINKQRPTSSTKNMKILHDNARPHVTKTVKSHLNQAGITIIRHSPYSPHLALSDYWLFDLIKKNLDDHTDVKSKNVKLPRFFEIYRKKSIKKRLRSG